MIWVIALIFGSRSYLIIDCQKKYRGKKEKRRRRKENQRHDES